MSLDENSTGTYQILNQTSLPLKDVEDNSINYVLTDPPYGDVIQYSELTFIWNTWIEKNQNVIEELIINPVQDKDMDYFIAQISIFISECFRVLKDNGKITICFQNKDPDIWFKLIRIAKFNGYLLDSVEAFDYQGSPYNKNWSTRSPKMDLYVTLIKSQKALGSRHSEPKMDFQQLAELSKITNAPDGKNQIDDIYSRFIACAIVSIMSGVDVENISKKDLLSFTSSTADMGGINEEYYQGNIFQNI
jgi:DNA modification methylase